MKIVFMGTPEFAVPALKKLIDSKKHEVCVVYTKEPRKAGRGQKVRQSPIHALTLGAGIEVYTPKTLRDKEELKRLKGLNPDIIIVVAYGLILPPEVLSIPKYGCLNIHPSLLPRWRGAAPMQKAILSGDRETGVCIMKMDEGLDSGVVVDCVKIPIKEETDIKYLHDTLSEKGADLLLEILDKVEKDKKISGKKQEESLVTYAKKLKKTEGRIDWSKAADEISRQIRALWVIPGVYFVYKGQRFNVFKVKKVGDSQKKPGLVLDDKLTISCGKNALQILNLQREGKKPMSTEEFLRGFEIKKGEVLE